MAVIEVLLLDEELTDVEIPETPETEVEIQSEFVEVGYELPIVTEEDNGKILQVDDGRWVKKSLPPCDEEISQISVNAVQNKAVAAKFAEVETTIGNIDVLLGTI